MSFEPGSLPEFQDPPVVEVALSIKFKTMTLTTGHIGLLWQHFRSEFPLIEDQPPLDSPIEVEKERVSAQAPGQIRFLSVPKTRAWFVSRTGTQLIQVQHDLFAHNWRRNDTGEAYPRFSSVRESFRNELNALQEFLAEQGLAPPEPIQCEVTYVNHIRTGATWTTHDQIHKVFNIWSSPNHEFLPTLDDGRFWARFIIKDASDQFCGRLHVSAQPAFAMVDGVETPIFATTLTARGGPITPDVGGALAFLDLGHGWIVRGFADITTSDMHSEWRRSQ